jgi:hypothetical protein
MWKFFYKPAFWIGKAGLFIFSCHFTVENQSYHIDRFSLYTYSLFVTRLVLRVCATIRCDEFKQRTPVPEQSTGVLRQSTDVPEQSTGVPRQSIGVPEQSTGVPRQSTGALRQSVGVLK